MTIRININTELVQYADDGSEPQRHRITLRWAENDPHAVRIVFRDVIEKSPAGVIQPLEWVVARDTLSQGLASPAGGGDVDAWPETGWLVLRLTGSRDSAVFRGDPAVFTGFLCGSYAAVPRDESMDFDTELTAFLKGASTNHDHQCAFCGATAHASVHDPSKLAAIDHSAGCRVLEIRARQNGTRDE